MENSTALGYNVEVYLSDNQIEGDIPGEWERFWNLTLDLSDNKIDSISVSKNDGFKDRWYVTEEVCKLLNVSRRTLQTMRDNKVIAYKKTGRKIYYKASNIEAYLESINE